MLPETGRPKAAAPPYLFRIDNQERAIVPRIKAGERLAQNLQVVATLPQVVVEIVKVGVGVVAVPVERAASGLAMCRTLSSSYSHQTVSCSSERVQGRCVPAGCRGESSPADSAGCGTGPTAAAGCAAGPARWPPSRAPRRCLSFRRC